MNIMRKWWGAGGGRGEGSESPGENSEQQKQHLALGLMHLKKLFSELLYPSHPLSEDEKEDKLYNMLPLFCKVNCVIYRSTRYLYHLLTKVHSYSILQPSY